MDNILIEKYRGFEIMFNVTDGEFYTELDDYGKRSKTFAPVKKGIDDYLKENNSFKPFYVVMSKPTDVLKQLKLANRERCPEYGTGGIEGWTLPEWACAVAGETGEMCNIIKKLHRGDKIDLEEVGKEAADIVIYLDMLCQRAGIDLQTAIVNKFNEVSERIGSKVQIYYP